VFCFGVWIITQLGVGEGALQLGLQVLCCWFIVRKVELVVSKGGLTEV
ncbi:hypothetical protein LINPERPRIM_LOCUS24482, partial [Linum perenne]